MVNKPPHPVLSQMNLKKRQTRVSDYRPASLLGVRRRGGKDLKENAERTTSPNASPRTARVLVLHLKEKRHRLIMRPGVSSLIAGTKKNIIPPRGSDGAAL